MTIDSATDRVPPVWLLAMLSALGPMATSIYQPSIPAVAAGLATSTAAVQSTLTVYLATMAVASLSVGPICDYLGRKPVLLAGLVVYSLASAACMTAVSIDMLIAARVFQAIGACAAGAVGGAVVRDVYDPRQLVRVMALYSIFVSLMPGLSPGVGGLLQDLLSWRAPFAFICLLGLMLLGWGVLVYRETLVRKAPSISVTHVGRKFLELLRRSHWLVPAVLGGVPLGGIFAYSAGAPVLIISELGLKPTYYGLMVALTVSGIISGSFLVRRLSARLGPVFLLAAGVGLLLGGGVVMLVIVSLAPSIAGVISTAFVYMLGMGIVIPASGGLAMQRVEPHEAATAGALSGSLHMLFGAAGAAWTSLTTTMPAAGFPLVMAIMGLLGVVLWVVIRVNERQSDV